MCWLGGQHYSLETSPLNFPVGTERTCSALRSALMNLSPINVQSLIHAGLVDDARWFDEIESTNTCLLEQSPFARAEGLYLVGAERQTAGRGRSTKRWQTGDGALTFSLQLRAARQPSLIAFRTALAVSEAVRPCVQDTVAIKWPNDVMCSERKLAGILIEARPDVGTVIGVGINVNNRVATADPELRSSMTSLADRAGNDVSRQAVLSEFVVAFRRWLASPSDEVIEAVRGCNWLQGRVVSIVDGLDDAVRARGQVVDVHQDGSLVLQTGESLTMIHSGSVRVESE